MENWGLEIRRLRKARGLTQAQLAEKAGLHPSYIARIERSHYKATSQDTFARLASTLDMTSDQLTEAITGKHISQEESPEQILERLRLATPVSIPVYTDFAIHAGEPVAAVDYVYLPRAMATKKTLEAYIVHGDCLVPLINNNDVVIVDTDRSADYGDIVACLYGGELHLGKLKKIGDADYLENSHGTFKVEECQRSALVIQVIRKLK